MEIIRLYSIWDKEASRFDTPFFAISDLFAKRKFMMFLEERNSIFSRFKNSFELHCIGSFSTLNGEFECIKKIIIKGNQIGGNDEISNEASV